MEVDLTNRGVAELEFCAEGSSVEESAAALQVKVLRADHNRIQRIVGLSSVFSNLVALHLSGNSLGSNTTVPKPLSYSTVAHFQEDLCDGMAPWLAALPSSLEYIDVSKNEILSLCCCVCGSGKAPNRDVSITDRYLHHALPLSLSVFFSSDRFPHLKRINLSHNRLESVSGGGQAEEGVWNTVCAENGTTKVCTAESIDVSYNPNVKTLDGILWATDCLPLQRISCEGCGIDDLRGLAAVPTYCPMVSQLLLRGSTLSSVFFSESPQEVRELLEANLPTLLSNKGWTAEGVNPRIDEPTLEIIDSTVKQYIQDTSRKAGCAFPSLSFALYAFFVGDFITSLVYLDDNSVDVSRECLVTAVERYLGAPVVVSKASGLRELALSAEANARSKVMVREDGAYPSADPVARPTDALSVLSPVMQPRGVTADVTAQGDSFVPSALSEGEKLIYEALVQECGQLQERLSESRETCAQVEDTMRSLNTQLSEERKLVSDQGQEILRLKEKKHNLTLEIDAKRKGVTKRKKELFYAVSAIQSIDSHVEQKILLQAEQQERTQKSRRHNSAARQKRVSPAPVPKRNKSDILRSEAAKNRIQSQKESGDDPYTPNHFRSTAKSSTLARKEWSPCYAEQAENEKEANPGPPGHARHGADVRTPADGAPPARNNLSALSIEELFEAAASIKKRQLALQQMHSSILNESPFTDGLRPETSSTNSDARQIFSVIVKQQEKNNAEPHDAEAERLSQPSSVSSVVENEVSLTDHIPSGGDDVDTSKEPTNRQLF